MGGREAGVEPYVGARQFLCGGCARPLSNVLTFAARLPRRPTCPPEKEYVWRGRKMKSRVCDFVSSVLFRRRRLRPFSSSLHWILDLKTLNTENEGFAWDKIRF